MRLPLLVWAALLAPVAAAAACASADLKSAPQTETAACPTAAVFCDAMAPGSSDASCRPQEGASSAAHAIPSGDYPVGCSANVFSGARGGDGTCDISSACTCTAEDGGSAAWSCSR